MKRFIWVLCLIVLAYTAQVSAQVLADFETAAQGTQGFAKGWGDALTDVQRITDPVHGGVMELTYNSVGNNSGAVKIAPLDLKWTETTAGASFYSFDIFVPADFPDSAIIKVWGQDLVNWQWIDNKYSNAGIEGGLVLNKGQWNIIYFEIDRAYELNNKFLPWNCQGGVEVWFKNAWTGKILIDNYSIWGVEPKVDANFDDASKGTQGFAKGWGDALTDVQRITDPVHGGVIELTYNSVGNNSGALKLAPLDLRWTETIIGAGFFSFDVYIPADFPDSCILKLWGQDLVNWSWIDYKYSNAGLENGRNLKKDAWNTVVFPVKRANQLNNKFLPWNCQGGIEIWFKNAWTGKVLVDNYSIHTLEVGKKWVMADFETEARGVYGFQNTGWAAGITGITWAADPTTRSVGVMKTSWDASKATLGSFENQNIDLKWTATDTGATAMTIDIWIPVSIPQGVLVSFFATDKITWTWTEISFTVTDSTIKPGQWNTITYPIDSVAFSKGLNPVGVIRVGIQVYTLSANWIGDILFDNFTLVGIDKPEGSLKSPTITVSQDDALYNMIQWEDTETNLNETYNVYISAKPITNLASPDVVRIASQITRGVQYWNHRPYGLLGEIRAYYYAVTATSVENIETELLQAGTAGPFSIALSDCPKAYYNKNFNFALDGSLSEFEPYNDYMIKPEFIAGNQAATWDSNSTDLNLKAWFVIDDHYLYLGAEITDDDMAVSGQAWQGDALELLMGFYNAKLLTELHDKGDIGNAGTGDYRISFTSWGTTQSGGSADFTYPGLEFLTIPGPTSYMIEAKINLDSLAPANTYNPKLGDMMPFRIDINDIDKILGDSDRSLQINIGGISNSENWLRPCSWGYLLVYDTTLKTDVVEPNVTKPLINQLHANYPNPFNPVTTITYELSDITPVSLTVYNVLGQEIKTLVKTTQSPGTYRLNWDGLDARGTRVPSGVYFCQLQTNRYEKTQKMMLMK